MLDLSYMLKDMTERNIKATNPYSGQSEMLTQSEAIHYFMVKKFEELGQYELMQEGLSRFSKMNPKAFMIPTTNILGDVSVVIVSTNILIVNA